MQDNLSSLLGTLLGQPNEVLRKGDHAAASILLDIRGDHPLMNAAEALMTGAAILIFSSRQEGASFEKLQLVLEDALAEGIETALGQAHSMMHRGDEELAADPFRGSMVATVVRGMSAENQMGNIGHDELLAYIDGPFAEWRKSLNARMQAWMDAKEPEEAPPST